MSRECQGDGVIDNTNGLCLMELLICRFPDIFVNIYY